MLLLSLLLTLRYFDFILVFTKINVIYRIYLILQLSTFPMFQQFGLVFREKYEALGITNAETTTIINLNSAFNACVGGLVYSCNER